MRGTRLSLFVVELEEEPDFDTILPLDSESEVHPVIVTVSIVPSM